MRGGTQVRIAGRDVVREDLLMIAEGDRIPADGTLLQAHELAANESMLTGESEPVAKQPADKVFAGTLVVSGQGLLQVTAVGRHTELGRIGQSLDTIALQASPLREEMARLTRKLVAIGLSLCALLVALFWALRGDWLQAVLAGITLAMGVLPQELPVIMIIFPALAARRLAAQQVLTRRLNAIETLGQTTVLCVDKTGTLTQKRMAVAALRIANQELDVQNLPAAADGSALPDAFHELLEYAVLASEIEPHDPMKQAFHRMAADHLVDTEHLHPAWSLAREYELSPQLLAMSHLWRDGTSAHDTVATKGAPEAVADLCHLPDAERASVSAQAARLADRGLRVLGVAKARHRAQDTWPDAQHDFDFEWLGLVALADPLRPEVPQAVAQCRQAGIRVVMITGAPLPRTARAIAAQAGIANDRVITGDELAHMPPQVLADQVQQVSVFARIKPHQKLALVEALKAQGEVVAMTGDGVNDAPALKAATDSKLRRDRRPQQSCSGLHQLLQLPGPILLDGVQHHLVDAPHHGHGHHRLQGRLAFALARAVVHHIQHQVGQLLVGAAARGQARGAQAQNVDEQGAQQHRVTRQHAKVGGHGLLHLGLPVAVRVNGSAQHRDCIAAGRLIQCGQALGFVGKIFIKGTARHAGFAHDVGNGGVGIALGGHCARHALQEAGAVFGAHSGCGGCSSWGGDFTHGGRSQGTKFDEVLNSTIVDLHHTNPIGTARYQTCAPPCGPLCTRSLLYDRTRCPPPADRPGDAVCAPLVWWRCVSHGAVQCAVDELSGGRAVLYRRRA